jgi:HD-like signal output (HDOD) protein
MPSTFSALQRALADPSIDLSKVSAIIEKDPAVSAKVLQVCNSAFFRLPRRVSTIKQAVSYLGLSIVRSMVLSAEVFRPGKPLSPGLDLGQMQRHALSVAAIARSPPMPRGPRTRFSPVCCTMSGSCYWQFKDQMQQVLEATAEGKPLAEAEQEYVGVSHGIAGGYLLGLWGLPYEVVEAVAHHEVPTRVAYSSFDVLGTVVVAPALLLTINPRDVPAFEAQTPMLDDDYLREVGFPHSWDSLVERATTLLGKKVA